jgi:hypothetical protein
MSGGSFSYLYGKEDIDELIQYEHEVQSMADELAKLGYADDVAQATEDLLFDLRIFRNRIRIKQRKLAGVWKVMEWWKSSDSSEESFKEKLEEWRMKND